jgi:hypothetical protein
MAMTDPLGDMLTRIRNGVARRKSSVSTPASKLRARVLDVLQAEGYIRGYTEVAYDNGKSELSIELKYHEGAPRLHVSPSRAVACTSPLSPFRRSPTVSALRSFRLRRAFWPIMLRASTMLVVRFSARSSDRAGPPTRTDRLNNVSYR